MNKKEKYEKKRKEVLKQAPVLKKIPEQDEVKVFNSVVRSPLFLGLLLFLVVGLFWFNYNTILELDFSECNGAGSKRKIICHASILFLPVLLPFMGILAFAVLFRNFLLKKAVTKYIESH